MAPQVAAVTYDPRFIPSARVWNRLSRLLVIGASATLASACSQPSVDVSTDDSFKRSLQAVRATVAEERREEFDKAVLTIAMKDLSLARIMSGTMTPDTMSADMKAALNGKTADTILNEAAAIDSARRDKEKAEALKEIAALRAEREASIAAQKDLERFEILRARFSKTRNALNMAEPRILLQVRNGTPHAVARAYFEGILESPGRSVPWLREDFNYEIRGGLEPGETATWNLQPNMFSEWGTVEAPPDVGLKVRVTRLDGPDGKALFDAREFTDTDAARLEALQKQYGAS